MRCVEVAAGPDVPRPTASVVVTVGVGRHLRLRPPPGALGLPGTFGHELAGWLPDGRAVAVEPIAPCWECRRLRRR